MLTRDNVGRQYHHQPGAPPPLHVGMPYHQHPPGLSRDQLYGSGGLMGGAVTLTSGAPTGMRAGDTGYGYLGMDPSAPQTWPRAFNPAPGMITRLNMPPGTWQGVKPMGGGAVGTED